MLETKLKYDVKNKDQFCNLFKIFISILTYDCTIEFAHAGIRWLSKFLFLFFIYIFVEKWYAHNIFNIFTTNFKW